MNRTISHDSVDSDDSVYSSRSKNHNHLKPLVEVQRVLLSSTSKNHNHLKPLAEVQRALLVVEVLKAPSPELGSLLILGGGEHLIKRKIMSKDKSKDITINTLHKLIAMRTCQLEVCNKTEIYSRSLSLPPFMVSKRCRHLLSLRPSRRR